MATLEPVDFDPFAAPSGGTPTRITVRPGDAQARLEPVDYDPFAGAASAAGDVVKSGAAGLGQGVAGLIGSPAAVGDLYNLGMDKALEAIGSIFNASPETMAEIKTAIAKGRSQTAMSGLPTTEGVRGAIEGVTGKFHEPQTKAGEYARTVGEFLPGAVAGPGGVVRNAITFGAVPGAASEFAGQQFKGQPLEPWVRGGAAVATGGAGALLTARGNVTNTVRSAAEGATPQQLRAAEALFGEAQAMGMPITRAEAIQHVTNGATNFGNLQRVVEGQGGMRDFFAARPGQTEVAAGQALDGVAPAVAGPSSIGPAIGAAADDTIKGVKKAINTFTDPYYKAAEGVRLSPAEMAQVKSLPGYEAARKAVRGDPQLNRYVSSLPDDSLGFLNEVKKQLDQAAENAASPVQQGRNMQRSAGFGKDAETVRTIGQNASPEYAAALGVQAAARERYLDPLLAGPLGQVAKRDLSTRQAIDALFPTNPLPNSADEIATAVSSLAKRNPLAARQLVRAHAESVFNESTQRLQTGANEFGGAKFAAVIRGNPQQAENLQASVRALPNGDQIWNGFDRFLNVLEAQGTRQRVGSQTAFNQEVLRDLRQGKVVSEAGTALATGGLKLPTKIKDSIERYRLGRNVDQLADLLTNPNAAGAFSRMANSQSTGVETAAAFIRLIGLARVGAGSSSQPSGNGPNRGQNP